jgi:lysophospholipase L1-like esterase
MRTLLIALSSCLIAFTPAFAEEDTRPTNAFFAEFHPEKAPAPRHHFLKAGDQLAICGDSITEQKMYSRIIETYLTVCVPEMNVGVRQYGWSGETAPGFLARMTNDCLRFKPTIATTCYGMNDHEYRAYLDRIGDRYRSNEIAIDEAFKSHGARVIEGSAGCVGKNPPWSRDTNATLQALNLNLCQLRNIGIDIAKKEKIGFADVFWPMLTAGYNAREKYGADYAIAGKDGVHPGWAGHVVMAYAFLRSFGLDGDIGTFTVDMRSGKASVSSGHQLISYKNGELVVKSHRYPFCIGEGDPANDNTIRSGMTLVPFNDDLNRLLLVVKHPQAKTYNVSWGVETKSFSVEQLEAGLNLAAEFGVNPFSDAFNQVDQAVAAKQKFETREIKDMFHGDEGKADMEGTVARAEKERAPLVAAVKAAFVPVTHTIKITPLE